MASPKLLLDVGSQSGDVGAARADVMVYINPNDPNGWLELLRACWRHRRDGSWSPERVRTVYQAAVARFGHSPLVWAAYIHSELDAGNIDRATELLKQCLTNCRDSRVWFAYMRFRTLALADDESAHEKLERAFKHTLKHFGGDFEAGQVWQAYIRFIDALPVEDKEGTEQKWNALRQLYQRCVVQPVSHVDVLRKAWETLEFSRSRVLAEELLRGVYVPFTKAVQASRERERLRKSLNMDALVSPPLVHYASGLDATGNAAPGCQGPEPSSLRAALATYEQVLLWQRAIAYEKSEYLLSLEVEAKFSQAGVVAGAHRILYAYRQALQFTSQFPDIWLALATFAGSTGDAQRSVAAASAVYQEGIKVMGPHGAMLSFVFADFLERHQQVTASRQVYQSLVKSLSEHVSSQKTALRAREDLLNSCLSHVQTHGHPQTPPPPGADPAAAKAAHEALSSAQNKVLGGLRSATEIQSAVRSLQVQAGEVGSLGRVVSLAYIRWMQFERRVHSEPTPARSVFFRGCKSPFVSHHMYVACGWLEYHVNEEEKVARKLFTQGYKQYATHSGFVQQYLDFLWHVDDRRNYRAVLQASLAVFAKDGSARASSEDTTSGDVKAPSGYADGMAAVGVDTDACSWCDNGRASSRGSGGSHAQKSVSAGVSGDGPQHGSAGSIPAGFASHLLSRLHALETAVGADSSVFSRLEEQKLQAMGAPSLGNAWVLLHRYAYLDLWPVSRSYVSVYHNADTVMGHAGWVVTDKFAVGGSASSGSDGLDSKFVQLKRSGRLPYDFPHLLTPAGGARRVANAVWRSRARVFDQSRFRWAQLGVVDLAGVGEGKDAPMGSVDTSAPQTSLLGSSRAGAGAVKPAAAPDVIGRSYLLPAAGVNQDSLALQMLSTEASQYPRLPLLYATTQQEIERKSTGEKNLRRERSRNLPRPDLQAYVRYQPGIGQLPSADSFGESDAKGSGQEDQQVPEPLIRLLTLLPDRQAYVGPEADLRFVEGLLGKVARLPASSLVPVGPQPGAPFGFYSLRPADSE